MALPLIPTPQPLASPRPFGQPQAAAVPDRLEHVVNWLSRGGLHGQRQGRTGPQGSVGLAAAKPLLLDVSAVRKTETDQGIGSTDHLHGW